MVHKMSDYVAYSNCKLSTITHKLEQITVEEKMQVFCKTKVKASFF